MLNKQCAAPVAKCKREEKIEGKLRNNSIDKFQHDFKQSPLRQQSPKNESSKKTPTSNKQPKERSFDPFSIQQQHSNDVSVKLGNINNAQVNSTQICDITNVQNISKISNIEEAHQSICTMEDIDKIEDVFKASMKCTADKPNTFSFEDDVPKAVQNNALIPEPSIDFKSLEEQVKNINEFQ